MTDQEFQKLVLEKLGYLEGQLSETNQIVKALAHRTDELDAKYDGLAVNMAKGFARIEERFERIEERLERIEQTQKTQGESINILAMRQLQVESEIATLKKAK